MRILCWQTILMEYHTLFFRKLRKMLQNLSSAAVVIGALRVNGDCGPNSLRILPRPMMTMKVVIWGPSGPRMWLTLRQVEGEDLSNMSRDM